MYLAFYGSKDRAIKPFGHEKVVILHQLTMSTYILTCSENPLLKKLRNFGRAELNSVCPLPRVKVKEFMLTREKGFMLSLAQ